MDLSNYEEREATTGESVLAVCNAAIANLTWLAEVTQKVWLLVLSDASDFKHQTPPDTWELVRTASSMLKGERRTDVFPLDWEKSLVTAELSKGDDGREPALQATVQTIYSCDIKDGVSQGTALTQHTQYKNIETRTSADMTSRNWVASHSCIQNHLWSKEIRETCQKAYCH